MNSNGFNQIGEFFVTNQVPLILGGACFVLLFLIWLLLRSLRLWYWKVNERSESLKKIEDEIREIRLDMARTQGSVQAPPQTAVPVVPQMVPQTAAPVVPQAAAPVVPQMVPQAATPVQQPVPATPIVIQVQTQPAETTAAAPVIAPEKEEISWIKSEKEERLAGEREETLPAVEAQEAENPETPLEETAETSENEEGSAETKSSKVKLGIAKYSSRECGKDKNGVTHTREELETGIRV